jgi:hypothetical protein
MNLIAEDFSKISHTVSADRIYQWQSNYLATLNGECAMKLVSLLFIVG